MIVCNEYIFSDKFIKTANSLMCEVAAYYSINTSQIFATGNSIVTYMWSSDFDFYLHVPEFMLIKTDYNSGWVSSNIFIKKLENEILQIKTLCPLVGNIYCLIRCIMHLYTKPTVSNFNIGKSYINYEKYFNKNLLININSDIKYIRNN